MVRAAVYTLAAAVGFVIVGCVVHASIMASGGYETGAAPLMIALGCGLAIGSIAVGMAWGERRWFVTAGLITALVAGEAYALLLTAERVTAHREAQQAPLKAEAVNRAHAAQHVAKAELALVNASKDTPRLTRALAAKKAADEAAIGKSAEPGCAKNCRALLEQQVTGASAEVESARTEGAAVAVAAKQELVEAHAALDALPSSGSASPLADRLGIAGWELDLTAAALASLAANGLAAMLITFGAHGLIAARRTALAELLSPSALPALTAPRPQQRRSSAKALPKPEIERDPAAEAERFTRASFLPRSEGRVYLHDLRSAYRAWCETLNQPPLPDHEIGPALNDLFSSVGFRFDGRGADAVIVRIEWKPGGLGAPLLINGAADAVAVVGMDATKGAHQLDRHYAQAYRQSEKST